MERAYRITEEWKLYMYLLRCAIRGEKEQSETLEQYKEIDAQKLIEKAIKSDQLLLLLSHIAAFETYQKKEPVNYKISIKATVAQYQKYECIRKVLEQMKQQQIQIIVFKGCVLADLYPEYIKRTSCDTDLLVDKENREAAEKVLELLGYQKNEEKSNSEVQVYRLENPEHNIELHTCLWEDYTGKRLDVLESMQLSSKESLINIDACGIPLTTLGYEEHLVYQIFHIIKHFSLQGVGIKYLVDITLYLDAYGQYINYDSFWKKMKLLGYEKFCYELFMLCIEWLGMNDSIMEGKKELAGIERKLLLEDMFQIGMTYEDKNAGWQIMGMMTPYFVGEKAGEKTAMKRTLQVIFPKAKDLPDEYLYAKKCIVLLPVAWVHKAINYLIKYQKNKKTWYSVSEKLDVAQKRIALMDTMGLLDQK